MTTKPSIVFAMKRTAISVVIYHITKHWSLCKSMGNVTYILQTRSNNFCAVGDTPFPILSDSFCLLTKFLSVRAIILCISNGGIWLGLFLTSSSISKSFNNSIFRKLILHVPLSSDELGSSMM